MKVTLENLTKRFGKVTAVNELEVTFKSGKLTALLGPSGCGKSTLLFMLAGITPVTKGDIYFDDVKVTELAPEKRRIGLVFQNYALYPHMTVLQNICFPLEILKVPKTERLARAKSIMELVHIEDLLNRKPAELSGGQQQRVAITRALVKNPQLLLLDEPLSNLDARLRIEMREEIRRIQMETGVTTIFVTHDQEEAMSISDDILLMKLGQQQQYAKPQELYDDPKNLFVAEFLGNPPINKIPGFVREQQFVLGDGSASCQISPNLRIPNGTRVVMGARAESVQIASQEKKKQFDATITQVYRMGKEELTHLKIGSCEIRAYIPSEQALIAGNMLPISFKDKGVFLFNMETGERYV
jgi:multiple sugar transport system ATP-binding protein